MAMRRIVSSPKPLTINHAAAGLLDYPSSLLHRHERLFVEEYIVLFDALAQHQRRIILQEE